MKQAKIIIRAVVITLFSLCLLGVLFGGFFAIFLPGCESCHTGKTSSRIPQVSTTHTAHKNTKCSACHVGKSASDRFSFGMRQAYSMIIPVMKSHDFDSTAAYTSRCENCHKNIDKIITNQGITIDHDQCTTSKNCVECHGKVSHRTSQEDANTTYSMDLCYSCHADIANDKGCTLCHETRSGSSRISNTAWRQTHGPNWRKTHGMGDMNTCATCHAQSMCSQCHGAGVPHDNTFMAIHGKTALQKDARCDTCHDQSFCSDCHGIEMPHPKGFIKKHSKIATSNDDPACLKCHDVKDCTGCHTAHVHPGGPGLKGTK